MSTHLMGNEGKCSKKCTQLSDCNVYDANLESSGTTSGTDKCRCRTGYSLGSSLYCSLDVTATPCTNDGTECSGIANSVCDLAATPKCKCALYATMSASTCTAKACAAAGTCTVLDANSECSGTTLATDKCRCKTGYSLSVAGTCLQDVTSTVCTSTGKECDAITNARCDTTALKCKCGDISAMIANTCTGKACVAAATCIALDANSECSGTNAGSVCQCMTTHLMGNEGKCSKKCVQASDCTDVNSECSGTGSTDKCRCKTGYSLGSGGSCVLDVTSTVCTATGTECVAITNARCDTTALKCKCGSISAMLANTCTGKACIAAATCTALDANSECSGTAVGSVSKCNTGYTMGIDGKCMSGAAAVLVSMTMLFACFLARLL